MGNQIWFVRHGESRGNAGYRTATPAGTELTPLGYTQAERIAAVIAAAPPPELLVTSSYLRTKQTAAATLARLPHVRHEEWPLHEFAFLDPARFYNTSMAERRPAAVAYWERSDPQYCDGPGAESFSDFMARVDGALAEIRRRDIPFSVVFSHGFVIRAVMWRLLSPPAVLDDQAMARYWRFFRAVDVPNASIFKVTFNGGAEVLLTRALVDHLEPVLVTP